jgi:hypothetical protein
VNVQLIDAETDEHLWAERFDKERKDVLGVQDEIVARLSSRIGIEMVRREAARGSSSSNGGDGGDRRKLLEAIAALGVGASSFRKGPGRRSQCQRPSRPPSAGS